jgi:Mg-chelatase subunit ChlI/Mg-chelatase subunit ChlD
MSKGELKKVIGSLLHKKAKRIVTGVVRAGRRTDIMTVGRQGRYIRYRSPTTSEVQDIALLPTIKSAILHSGKSRKEREGKIEIKKRDYKEKVRRRKISSLICIVMDTSSSMVAHSRIMAIKAALGELMLDAYQKRDRISVVTCFGRGAEVAVPFTSSVDKGQSFVERAPYGGTTPLAAGIRKGLEALLAKLRVEKDTRALLVIVTDGTANVPIVPGSDVRGEIVNTCLAIQDVGVPTLVIDVSDAGSELAREMAENAAGHYHHAEPPEEAATGKGVDGLIAFDDVLQALMGALVNPDIRGMLVRGATPELLEQALHYLDSLSLEIKANAKCAIGCAPERPDDFCYTCRLRYLEAVEEPLKEIPTSLWTYPIVRLPKKLTKRDLIGEIYVRFVAQPGLVGRAHRGILYGGRLPEADGPVLRAAAGILERGFYDLEKDGSELRVPAKYTLVVTAEEGQEAPDYLARVIDMVVELKRDEDLYDSARTLTYRKGYDVDPARFEAQLDKARKEGIFQVIKARKMMAGMRVGAYGEDVIAAIASRFSPKEDFIRKVQKLARTYAAKRLRGEVDDSDIAAALLSLKPLWEIDEAKGSELPFMDVARSVAENEVIKDKLLMAFVAPRKVRGVLLSGFSPEAARNALKYVQDLGMEIDTVKGCRYLCDPLDAVGSCSYCHIKSELGEVETVKTRLPVVSVPQSATRERLMGRVFIHYLLTPNLLLRAHRGVLFVEDVDKLSSEAAEAIAEVLATGRNRVEGDDSTVELPCVFTLIGTLSNPDGEVHPMLQEQMAALVSYEELDEVRMNVRAERYARIFSASPEGFAAASAAEKAATLATLDGARSAMAKAAMTESQLDMTARICAELGAAGNTPELAIQTVAQVLSALRGESRVDDADILRAVKLVLPLYAGGDRGQVQESLRGLVLQNAG